MSQEARPTTSVLAAKAAASGAGTALAYSAGCGAPMICGTTMRTMPMETAATFWNHLLVGALLAFFAMVARLPDLRSRRANV